MPATYSTPGVYVEEISILPPSVVAVSTAVPAFLGYTETGRSEPPTRIQSLREYEQTFGAWPQAVTSVKVTTDDSGVVDYEPTLADAGQVSLLYYSLRLYFDNGGGPCYVVPLGGKAQSPVFADFQAGLDALLKEDEPTLVVMPDAVRLNNNDFASACAAALGHCGTMRDRFAVLDVQQDLVDDEGKTKDLFSSDLAKQFRDGVSSPYLSYGAAYTPFLKTSLVYAYDETQVTVNLPATGTGSFSAAVGALAVTCTAASNAKPTVQVVANNDTGATKTNFAATADAAAPQLTITTPANATTQQVVSDWTAWKGDANNKANGFGLAGGDVKPIGTVPATALTPQSGSAQTLYSMKDSQTGYYNQTKAKLAALRVTLPPSAAIAGIYASVDRDRGVWKAPANVVVTSVIGLDRTFSNADLDGLNIDANSGKSINAIRSFTGRGILVWGARTLAGNDNEWRYVPVRRLFIMIEESARKATAFAVFEPNTAETWLKVKAMIESFLYGLWEQGALAGTKPADAYFVNVGLGTTMTTQDVLEGRMIVKIGVAAVRPAEFIVLQFSHLLQTS